MRIGVDLGGTKTEVIVLADDGRALWRARRSTPAGDYGGTIRLIAAAVEEAARRGDDTVLPGLGVGIPGALCPHAGVIKNANSTWLIGSRLDVDLAAATGLAVRLENDANCFALSEATDGAAAGAAVVFGVILGTGVGGGVVVHGQPLRGPNSIAGEWGHNPLPWPRLADGPAPHRAEAPGPDCYCGKQGCLETFLSGPGLAADHAAAGGAAMTAAEIAAAAAGRDPVAAAAADATLKRYEDRLARGLAMVINVLDPDVIVLGGGISKLDRLYESLPPLLRPRVFSGTMATTVRRPVHGDSSGVRGAAWLWPLPAVNDELPA